MLLEFFGGLLFFFNPHAFIDFRGREAERDKRERNVDVKVKQPGHMPALSVRGREDAPGS